jgi:hypothetical protein
MDVIDRASHRPVYDRYGLTEAEIIVAEGPPACDLQALTEEAMRVVQGETILRS